MIFTFNARAYENIKITAWMIRGSDAAAEGFSLERPNLSRRAGTLRSADATLVSKLWRRESSRDRWVNNCGRAARPAAC
jgi:hypothetical protein